MGQVDNQDSVVESAERTTTMEPDEKFRTLSEIIVGEFLRIHKQMNERIGREHFRIPVPRCTHTYVPPILTRTEEKRMEERMEFFRSNDS